MQVTIRRFPCARVRAFVHVERVFEAACGIGDDLVEPVLLAEVCQGSSQKTESMVTPVFATPILTTSWLA